MGRCSDFLGVHQFRNNWRHEIRALVAEFTATQWLVMIACGAGITSGGNPIHIALAAGFAVTILIESVFHVSGGHINPAVTIGLLATGNITLIRALLYVVVQSLGGVVGAAVLKWTSPAEVAIQSVTAVNSKAVKTGQAFGIEAFITMVLVFVVCASTDPNRREARRPSPAMLIGMTIAVGHFYAVHLTGASMNPARSFGPALVFDVWKDQWLYWLGPILGGVIGGLTYKFLFAAPATPVEEPKVTVTPEDTRC